MLQAQEKHPQTLQLWTQRLNHHLPHGALFAKQGARLLMNPGQLPHMHKPSHLLSIPWASGSKYHNVTHVLSMFQRKKNKKFTIYTTQAHPYLVASVLGHPCLVGHVLLGQPPLKIYLEVDALMNRSWFSSPFGLLLWSSFVSLSRWSFSRLTCSRNDHIPSWGATCDAWQKEISLG